MSETKRRKARFIDVGGKIEPMSGIAGLFRLDGQPVSPTDPTRMIQRLAHRGPDGSHSRTDGAVGLAHCLLWTTLESRQETQPLAHRNGDLLLTADARIDNRDELLSALQLESGEALTDSELILYAYGRWGENCPERLLGDFAFAVWDRRERRLFCARDPLGVKPFCYCYLPGRLFAFASEIKGLLALADVPRRLNEPQVAVVLLAAFADKESTIYQDILKLSPAHSLRVQPEGITQRSYWSLDPKREIRLGSDEEYAEAFRSLFMDAVRCRLRSAYPVGSMLSGGLDSSSITCAARKLAEERPLPTFSVVFDTVSVCDERRYIETVVAQGGIDPHYVHGDRIGSLHDIDRVYECEDEPLTMPNLFLHRAMYRAARERGIRVLLDGVDGDTTISHGVGYLTELARTGRWIRFYRETKAYADLHHRSLGSLLFDRGIRSNLPGPVINAYRRIRGHRPASETYPFNPDFTRRNGISERALLEQADNPLTENPRGRLSRWKHYRLLSGAIVPLALEVADRSAASFGLEARYPFFDRRLVEFCLALPTEQKVYQGWTRSILRRGMEGLLPKGIQCRLDKSNLGPNFTAGFLQFDRSFIEDCLEEHADRAAEYVSISRFRDIFNDLLAFQRGEDAILLWRLVNLSLWLRKKPLSSVLESSDTGGYEC